MALRFIDSFDHYATADIIKKWSTLVDVGQSISTAQVRSGSSSLLCASDKSWVSKVLDDQASWVVGFAFYYGSAMGEDRRIAGLLDDSTIQVGLNVKDNGRLSITRNGSTVAAGTDVTDGISTLVLSINTWYYIEFKCTIANSIGANTCQVNVNGAQWINVATGQDLQQTANATANAVFIGQSINTAGLKSLYFDDFYACDGTGSKNNDFLGDVVVEAIFPDGNGTTSDFLGSDANSVDNYLHVDEVAPDGDSTYVGSSGVADRDLYTFGNLSNTPATDGIHGIVSHTAATKTEAGARVGKVTIRTGATNYDGADFSPSNGSYLYFSEVWEQNPNTVANWLEADVNGLESGIKVES